MTTGTEGADIPAIRAAATVRGSDRPSACMITWLGQTWLADPADVRAAAVDMIECSLVCRMMRAMLVKLGAPAGVLGAFTGDIISRPGKTQFGNAATVLLQPVGSTADKEAWVRVTRGGLAHDVDSDVIYALGRDWLEVAQAVDSDRQVVAALRAIQAPDGFEALLMAQLCEQRDGPGAPV